MVRVGATRVLIALVCAGVMTSGLCQPAEPGIDAFLSAADSSRRRASAAQAEIVAGWQDGFAPMLVDLLDIVLRTRDLNRQAFMQPASFVSFVEERTGQTFGEDVDLWREWVWSQPYAPHAAYGEFKGRLYGMLDPRFVVFFRSDAQPTIRLDEIVWGGVSINGIPPLDHPQFVAAPDAAYLDDDDVVFGISIDGEARAYPKRILAWHELALDRVKERELAIVYCTLCGTVIAYDARVGGKVLTFGTSGLLYRSNKLMFDHETASLWSSLTGEPVVGPLVKLDLRLAPLPVVTTTWGEWRARHADTRVLSLDTGFTRDYSEGAAYRAYFGTDELMFGVALRDGRLPNKAEVLVVRSTSPDAGAGAAVTPPFAISTSLLRERAVLHTEVAGTNVVIITSPGGASRAYAAQNHRFVAIGEDGSLLDTEGGEWVVDEDSVSAVLDPALRLPRLPTHRAFWFGWYAQHPDTVLVQ